MTTSLPKQFASPNPSNKFITPDKLQHLIDVGYVIIPNVLSQEECFNFFDQMFDWLKYTNPKIDRNNPSTWNVENWPPSIRGILMEPQSFAHAQFLWNARQHSNIIQAYQELWCVNNPRDIVTSTDRFCIMKPVKDAPKYKPWPHLDQGPQRPGIQCVQGFVTLEDVGENEGSLIVYERSHKYFEEFYNKISKDTTLADYKRPQPDWYVLNLSSDKKWFLEEKGCKIHKITCPKGSLVLWDGRTVHYNCGPNEKSDLFRVVLYICMTPRDWCDEENLKKKRQYFAEMQATTHWPHLVKPFTKKMHDHGVKYAPFRKLTELPVLTEIGSRLAGFDKHEDYLNLVKAQKKN